MSPSLFFSPLFLSPSLPSVTLPHLLILRTRWIKTPREMAEKYDASEINGQHSLETPRWPLLVHSLNASGDVFISQLPPSSVTQMETGGASRESPRRDFLSFLYHLGHHTLLLHPTHPQAH